MGFITFDISFKYKTEMNAFKLLSDSEFQQLKMMICGKYKIYDINKVQIYYRNELIQAEDSKMLKDIFKFKKIRLDVGVEGEKLIRTPASQPLLSSGMLNENDSVLLNNQYQCKCKLPAVYICDRCNEFMCESCSKKMKHLTHINKVIKLNEFTTYIKDVLRQTATELDEKITNDETYQFFQYWNDDLNNELNNINKIYEQVKSYLEDIKGLQIDYLTKLSKIERFTTLKSQIDDVIMDYASIDLNENYDKLLIKKRKILKESKDILIKYEELKNILIVYTNVVKDTQQFNNNISNDLKKKLQTAKKKYYIPFSDQPLISSQNSSNTTPVITSFNTETVNRKRIILDDLNNIQDEGKEDSPNKKQTNTFKKSPKRYNTSINNIANTSIYFKSKNESYNRKAGKEKLKNKSENGNTSEIPNRTNSSNNINEKIIHQKLNSETSTSGFKDKCIFKLKNYRRMIIFSTVSQTFKEKEFLDNSNFRANMTNEIDTIQLNLNNKLYLLSGKKYNKFYVYDYSSNIINFISNTLYSHYYGTMIYCNKNNNIYLLGGNNQIKCEKISMEKGTKIEWENIPPLTEERQEFAAMYFNDYIYVFFGFSPIKGFNLSSIERINVDLQDKFEVIYINEQITLSNFGCALYVDENDNTKEILILGGFDGKNYLDSSFVFSPEEMKISDCDIIIPNMSKHTQFVFHKECSFLTIEDNNQISFDAKNNVHLISKDSYELFSEANEK